jgi:hypothetical protein
MSFYAEMSFWGPKELEKVTKKGPKIVFLQMDRHGYKKYL